MLSTSREQNVFPFPFIGLAGTLYFWSDLFEPQMARFPAFEL